MGVRGNWTVFGGGICAFACVLALSATADSFTGKVVRVADGDTISVMRDGREEKVRLHGIDSPELGQAFGNNAKQFTSEQCFGQDVTVSVTDRDRYGRTVGVVGLSDGRVLNHELVAAGLAWWYPIYAKSDQALSALHDAAKSGGKGLWADTTQISPWDFRRDPAAALPPIEPQPAPAVTAPVTRPPPPAAAERMIVPAPAAAAVAAPVQSVPNDATVYITRTGSKYHRAGCRYLSKSQIPMSLSDAQGRYGACSVCRP